MCFADRPTLVILLGNDSSDPRLTSSFEAVAKQARQIYGKDFDIKELSQSKGNLTPADLAATLGALRGTPELHLLMVDHGIANAKREFKFQSDPPIYGTQIKDAIVKAIQNNPGMRVYIPSDSCYGGALGDQLADIPGVLMLPSVGNDRPNLLDPNASPTQNLLSKLANHQDYAAAEEYTWSKQLPFLTSSAGAVASVTGTDDLPMPMRELSLLRTGSELFLETWCASEENKNSLQSSGFCVRTDLGSNIQIPEGLKDVSMMELQSSSRSHLAQVQKARAQIGCGDKVADDPAVAEFQKLRTVQVKKLFETLASKIDTISLDDFKKNLTAGYEDDIKRVQKGILVGITVDQINDDINRVANLTPANMAKFQAETRAMMKNFKDGCLQSENFEPARELPLVFGGNSPAKCGEYFTYSLEDSFKRFDPEDFKNPIDRWNNYISMPGGALSDSFKGFAATSLLAAKKGTEGRVYRNDVANLIGMEIPQLKDYCALVDGSIAEYKHDLGCMDQFRKSASSNDWSRFLDLYSLSHRTLGSAGK